MKPTIAKLKIILRSNVDSFVNSAIVSSLLYFVVYILISHLLPKLHTIDLIREYQLTHTGLLIGALLFFTIPVVIYLLQQISQSVNGISLKPTDSVKAKRFLFIHAGIMWVSLAVIVISIAQNVDYLALGALILSLINWVSIHRTFGAYVVL